MALLELSQLEHGFVVHLLELALVLLVNPPLDLEDVLVVVGFLADWSFRLLWSEVSTLDGVIRVLDVRICFGSGLSLVELLL